MEWLPIETAPRDGTWIIVLIPDSIESENPRPFVTTTRWLILKDEWWEQTSPKRKELQSEDVSRWENYETPTHWLTLPTPTTPPI